MARYYLHLRDGADEVLDPLGEEFASLESLSKRMLVTARDLMSADLVRHGILDLRLRIDAEDKSGKVVHSLPFRHAVRIVAEDGESNAG